MTTKDRIAELVDSWKSLSALAREVGVAEGTLRKWKKGESEPRASELIRLARAGKVTVAWLLGLSDEKKGAEVVRDDREDYNPTEESLWDRLRAANKIIERLSNEYGTVPAIWSTTIQELIVVHGVNEEGAKRVFQSINAERQEGSE